MFASMETNAEETILNSDQKKTATDITSSNTTLCNLLLIFSVFNFDDTHRKYI